MGHDGHDEQGRQVTGDDREGVPAGEVEVSPVEPGDQLSFDLLRWTGAGKDEVPDAEAVLRGCYRSVTGEPVPSTLGDYLCTETTEGRVATGSTPTHEWIADVYQLALRPRKEPWPSIRDRAEEVHRVACTEWIDVALWAHWSRGVRVREVQFGLSERPVVRGRLQDFEQPLWDGEAPDPHVEPRLEPVPEDERVDIEALIAAEPPENLEVDPDGQRRLFITDSLPVEDGIVQLPPGRGSGSGLTIETFSGPGGQEDVVRPFVVLDTLNHVAVWDDVDDAWPDQVGLVQAALERWMGLTGPMCAWDWPCQVWTVRR